MLYIYVIYLRLKVKDLAACFELIIQITAFLFIFIHLISN